MRKDDHLFEGRGAASRRAKAVKKLTGISRPVGTPATRVPTGVKNPGPLPPTKVPPTIRRAAPLPPTPAKKRTFKKVY